MTYTLVTPTMPSANRGLGLITCNTGNAVAMGKTFDDFVGNVGTTAYPWVFLGVRWNSSGADTVLAAPSSYGYSYVADMNDSLESCGYTTEVVGGNPLPASWSSSGALTHAPERGAQWSGDRDQRQRQRGRWRRECSGRRLQ